MTGPKSRTWSRFRRAQKAAPQGYGSSSWGGGPLWADAFKSKRGPSPVEMVEAHKSILFFCSRFNSRAVSATPLRLYIRTEDGQTRPKSYMGAKPVGRWMKSWLKAKGYCTKFAAGSDEIEEVTGEHPILEAFRQVNPFLDLNQLISLTVTYTDLVGQAYWEPVLESIGGMPVPKEIWILPAQVIWPVPDGVSLVPKGYQYFSKLYLPEELIRFREPGMRNPYMDGNSPGRSVIEYARLEDEAVSVQDDMWSGGPRPSLIMSPKSDKVSIGDSERKRYRQEFNQMGSRGRMGGIAIVDGAVTVTPVSWQPVDLGAMEINKYNLERIANGLDIPAPFYTKETNLANMQAAREFHAKNGVEPRCMGIASTLTRFFHAMDTGKQRGWERLFWAFDPCVEEDKKAASEQHTTYVKMGVINRDTVALELGYDALPDGLGQAYTVEGKVITLDSVVNPPEPVAPAPGAMLGQEQDQGEPDEDDAANDEEDQEAPPKNGKPKGANGEGEHRYPFSAAVIEKARKKREVPSAHAILGGSLKSLGLTDRFLDGSITPKQRFKLLHQVRLDARAWLRAEAQQILDKYATELVEKALFGRAKEAVGKFFGKARKFIREAALAGTLAVLGPEPANQAELFAMNQGIEAQYTFLAAFRREIEEEQKPIDPSFVARAEQYGASTWPIAVNTVRESARSSGVFHEERRIHVGRDMPCDVCFSAQLAGWVPVGTLPAIGDSPCNCQCHCHFIYRVGEDDPREYSAGRGPMHEAAFGQYYDPGGLSSTPAAVAPHKPKPNALGATFSRSPKAVDAKQPTVLANVASLNAGWQKDIDYYIPPGGGSDQQKYKNAVKFIQEAIASGDPIEMPRITVDKDGTVSFLDGRHRFAAFRDLGAVSVPVSVDRPAARRARRIYGEPTPNI